MQQPPSLSRSSSTSSIASDVSTEPDTTIVVHSWEAGYRRTRKRFSNVQLMRLEHLYHQTSHPTRDQRDALAKEANMETRSVTVWFQNKRQTERRVALNTSSSARSTRSSPFSTPPGNAIHPHNRLPPAAFSSPQAASGPSRTSSIERLNGTAWPPRSSSLALARRHPSLDHIASRAERPHRTSPPPTPRRPRRRALGEHAVLAARERRRARGPAGGARARRLGRTRVRRMRTLEWACAAARMEGRAEEAMSEEALVLDLGGDTEDEGEHEAVTPKSSLGRSAGRRSVRGGEDKENMAIGAVLQIQTKEAGAGVQSEAVHDEDVMNAALALCGLGGRC
ncbi:homeobox-domain-containing protein [Amylocystis lapponica]|nr:homeobox-domain-containing protein [Amylocystis lapponica]